MTKIYSSDTIVFLSQLFTLKCNEKSEVAPDVPHDMMYCDIVIGAIRRARDLEAIEEAWQRFIESLNRKEKITLSSDSTLF